MLYIITKKYKKRVFLKLLCTKEENIKTMIKRLDITDIV